MFHSSCQILTKNKYFSTFIFLFFVHIYQNFHQISFLQRKHSEKLHIHPEKLQIRPQSCSRGYPQCTSVHTPCNISVGEFATFQGECATFQNVSFAKVIFDENFDFYAQRIEYKCTK